MTSERGERCTTPRVRVCARRRFAFIALSTVLLAACKAEPRNDEAVDAYYRYDFTAAREALRKDAYTRTDQQTILNTTRLGLAALADGDLAEAETALGTSFELLSTAGLNKDKTVAAVFDHEGVRIWKGEPFEQALTYHYVALTYAMLGDWENVRAAAANALFRLTDFGADLDAESLTRKAAEDEEYLQSGYTAVDTNFALGFVMQALGSDLAGTSGAREQFDAAVKINGDLAPIVERLRSRDYDTLLFVDYGRGPEKQAYGEDRSFVHFVPLDAARGRLLVTADDRPLAKANPVCDVNVMAQDHRWNNLEDVRRAKSIIGSTMLIGGAAATAYGADRGDAGTALIGVGAMALGMLTKAGARADTRYCEFMPQAMYLVPLTLEQSCDVAIEIDRMPATRVWLNDVLPGSARKPRVIYLRVFGDSPDGDIAWMTRRRERYSNDHTGVMRGPGGWPWLFGGGGLDVSSPTRQTLTAYQANGFAPNFTVGQLESVYRSEGVLIGSGMENRPDVPRNPSFRHVLEGGTGLFTPYPYSMGYLRIMNTPQPEYSPQSEAVRNAAIAARVMQERDNGVIARDDVAGTLGESD